MTTLRDVMSLKAQTSDADIDWLHRLLGDWQIMADLSFADLTLWVQDADGQWVLTSHARPTTGPNFYPDDVVGQKASAERVAVLEQVVSTARSTTPRGVGSIREQYVPVRRAEQVLGVLVRHTDLQNMRQQGGLEVNYLRIAQSLLTMVAQGNFPTEHTPTGVGRGTPRVGDGVIRLTADGLIDYASPNAVSALRRIGHTDQVSRTDLSEIVTRHLPSGMQVDEAMPLVLTGRAPWGTEIEARGLNLTLRCVPLLEGQRRVGALLLIRDVSEIRRRERELLTKDATIREIHHRVKNNLQTVAALLRLQSRRLDDVKAKAALSEAGRRLATVALVHDTLSHGFDESVNFDDVSRKVMRSVVEVAAPGVPVQFATVGEFGQLLAEDATPLAMILAELVHNAAEHGFAQGLGELPQSPLITLEAERGTDAQSETLQVKVIDNGHGLPSGQPTPPSSGLGMQIVGALLADLDGALTWDAAKPHGTVAQFVVRLRSSH